MKNLNVTSKNVFDSNYKNYVETSKNKQIIDFFKHKPFYQRTTKVAVFLALFAAICSVLSGFTESIFLHQKFSLIIGNFYIVLILVVLVVLIIEGVKRYTLPQIFRYYFQYKEIDFINLSIYVLAVAASVWLSFNGSKYLPSMVTEAEVVNVEGVAARYDAMITKAESEVEQYFQQNNWRGKLDNSSRPTYNQLTEAVAALKAEKLAAEAEAKTENKAIMAAYNDQNKKDGLQLGFITIASEIALFLIVCFLIYRKWRFVTQYIAKEQTIKPSTMASEVVLNLDNENRKQVVKTLKIDHNENRKTEGNKRLCKHCNKEYIYRHHKQKYCADKCRVAAYNKRNNTNLKYKATML